MTRVPVRKTYKLYVGGKFPRSESGLVRAPRLRAREGTAQVELVGLAHVHAGHPPRSTASPSNFKYGSSPCRPPSRPKPDSL